MNSFDLLYLSARDADLEEIGISRGVLLMYPPNIDPEQIANESVVLCGLNHVFTCFSLRNFDVSLEYSRVSEDKCQCRDGHSLWDGAEVENTLFFQSSQIE